MNWPVPLTARPAVQILRDQGIEWEQAKMRELASAFRGNTQANQQHGKYVDIELLSVLQQSLPSPVFILQPSFNHRQLKEAFLQNIGVGQDVIPLIPAFRAFRPDILWVQMRADEEVEILPSGRLREIIQNDQRKAIITCDIKHAGEANSSYSAEVCLYAVLLANWLQLSGLDDRYLVSSRMGLWTRGREVSNLSQLIASNPGATTSEKSQALWSDLEPIDFPIFFQAIKHFFSSDIVRALGPDAWTQLDWHVDGRCSACDFLGYRNWLIAEDRQVLDAHRDHYCATSAEDLQHLSRIATISRGGRRTLQSDGHSNVPAVSVLESASPVFDQHNALKADRNHLPHRANSLISNLVTIAPNTTTVDFPKWADLEIFLSVNFDSGSGLLTALGSEARFRQRTPFGQECMVQRNWPAEGQALLMATLAEERTVLISFLSRLAEVFAFVNDTDPTKGGPLAARTQVQVYLWDRRQFEELSKAIGRHLNIIVMQDDRFLRALVWLFPPNQALQDDELTLANPITFLKSVLQRNLRLPVAHSLTVFNVAEAYFVQGYEPRTPNSFYRDPLSDMIPRERIYEVWSGEPIIRIGTTQKSRSQCITAYCETVRMQVAAIRSMVWKFRSDMRGRLNFSASALDMRPPFNFQSMSEDGRLWYGWARLEEAIRRVELRRAWSSEPEELEAKYEILRFSQPGPSGDDGALAFSVRETSRDCKFRDGDEFLALQFESIPAFLDLRVRDLVPQDLVGQVAVEDLNRKMSQLFQATLVEFDRPNLRARVRLTTYGRSPDLRRLLITSGAVDLRGPTSLVSSDGPSLSDRVRQCLISIGRPSIAAPAAVTLQALGHRIGTNPPRRDRITTAARVLWDASALASEASDVSPVNIQAAINAIEGADWPFNHFQQDAVLHCLRHRLSIVWGPPGTGKTTTAAALVASRILLAQATGQNLRILICGPTYTAWEKLFGDTLELLRRMATTNVDCYRVYSQSHVARAPLPESGNPVVDLEATQNDPEFVAFVNSLQNPSRVVLVGAVAHQCYRISKQSVDSAQFPFFDFAIVDESSQLDIGKALFPLCLLSDGASISFFGDHLQMPPVVASQPPRDSEWLVGSIQTYLITRHACATQDLLTNYRASAPFVAFGRKIGYPRGLTSHSPSLCLHLTDGTMQEPLQWNPAVPWFPALSTICDPAHHLCAMTYEDGRAGQANEFEALLVCCIVQQLFLSFSLSLDNELDPNGNPVLSEAVSHTSENFWDVGVGIVTPHRAQRAVIVRRLQQIFPGHSQEKIDAAVDTVERFQGGQRNTILISFGVGDPDLIEDEEHFLLQLERTNVAISRARAKCILVISDDVAYHLPSDRETIQTSKAIKCYVSDFCSNAIPISVPSGVDGTRDVLLRWHE